MKIIVFGASGDVGSRLVKEALNRGHRVTAVLRDARKAKALPSHALVEVLDATDISRVAEVVTGHDLVVSALRPQQGHEMDLPVLTQNVLDAAAISKVRVLIVGGAASLYLPDNSGYTVLTSPGFLPDAVRPIAIACQQQFENCLAEENANWTYFSPPAALEPGTRTGHYRRGTDTLLVDNRGISKISMEDFAVSIIDEGESGTADSRHVTVAY